MFEGQCPSCDWLHPYLSWLNRLKSHVFIVKSLFFSGQIIVTPSGQLWTITMHNHHAIFMGIPTIFYGHFLEQTVKNSHKK